MGQYEDLQRLLDAIHRYRDRGELPEQPQEIDTICARVLANDSLDETAIEWKRIAKFEKNLNDGEWPEPDCENRNS